MINLPKGNFILYYELVSEKIIGYLLLLTGIIIILYAVINIYQVFSGKATPIELFASDGISLDLAAIVGEGKLPSEGNFKTEIISPDILNTSLNIFAHIFFMGFIVNVGFKIANLGTLLIRPINVKLKEASIPNRG